MAIKTRAVMLNLQSKLLATGRFKAVTIGEPTRAPESPHAAVLMSRYEVPMVTSGTIERRTLMIRIYIKAFQEPTADVEYLLDDLVTETMEDIFEDYDLGGNVRAVEPTLVTATSGYQQVDDTTFRLVDISVPVIIDDSATFAP